MDESKGINGERSTSIELQPEPTSYRVQGITQGNASTLSVLDRAAAKHGDNAYKLEPVRDKPGVYVLAMRPKVLVSNMLGANDWTMISEGTLEQLLTTLEE